MLLSRISVVSLLIVSLSGAVAIAQPNPQSPQPGTLSQQTPGQINRSRGHFIEQLKLTLNLSNEQLKQLSDLRKQYLSQISQKRKDLRKAKKELRDLMVGNANDNTIRNQFSQVQKLEQDVDQLNLDSMLAMRQVLTPEQRSKFAGLMKQRGRMTWNQLGNTIHQKR